jgi:hypothetical protein
MTRRCWWSTKRGRQNYLIISNFKSQLGCLQSISGQLRNHEDLTIRVAVSGIGLWTTKWARERKSTRRVTCFPFPERNRPWINWHGGELLQLLGHKTITCTLCGTLIQYSKRLVPGPQHGRARCVGVAGTVRVPIALCRCGWNRLQVRPRTAATAHIAIVM